MIQRIKEISNESTWILDEIVDYNFELEIALKRL